GALPWRLPAAGAAAPVQAHLRGPRVRTLPGTSRRRLASARVKIWDTWVIGNDAEPACDQLMNRHWTRSGPAHCIGPEPRATTRRAQALYRVTLVIGQ